MSPYKAIRIINTLDILSNISTEEAETFNKVISISTYYGAVFKIGNGSEWDISDLTSVGISFNDILTLREAGLMNAGDSISLRFDESHLKKWEDSYWVFLDYGDKEVVFGKNNNTTFELPQFSLSKSGMELLRILDRKANLDYLEKLNLQLRKRGFAVQIRDMKD